jgi:nicotinamide-nucleotide amidase
VTESNNPQAQEAQLTESLAQLLTAAGYRIATAESCTGGLIAKTLTDRAGSSDWFDRGFVTYSNQAKIDMLAVEEQTLEEFGAVSLEVAAQMARGALAHSRANLALSVTGIAGPGGGSEEKPVGLVCFGFALEDQLLTIKQQFEGDRSQVRQASLFFALEQIEMLLKSMK